MTLQPEAGSGPGQGAGVPPAEPANRLTQLQFLTQLGQALTVADEPVSSTKAILKRIAVGYNLPDAEIAVLPTMLLVRAQEHGQPMLDLVSDGGRTLRLDQVGHLYEIVDLARGGELTATEGLARLADLWAAPSRYGEVVRIGGHVVLALGLGLIMTPTALAWCAGLGLIVGVLREVAERWTSLDVLTPVVAALVVSVLAFLATAAGLVVSSLLLLIPPLITFLPGGTLTTAMIELADRQTIAGATACGFGGDSPGSARARLKPNSNRDQAGPTVTP